MKKKVALDKPATGEIALVAAVCGLKAAPNDERNLEGAPLA